MSDGVVAPRGERTHRVLRLAAAATIAAVALALVVSSAGGFTAVAGALEDFEPLWLVPAMLAVAAAYLLLGAHLRRLAGLRSLAYGAATALALVWFGLGNVLPGAPAPGLLIVGSELRRRGLDPQRVRLVLAFSAWFNLRTFLGLAAISALIATAFDHPPIGDTVLLLGAASGMLALLALTAAMASGSAAAQRLATLLSHLRAPRLRRPPAQARASATAWHAAAKAVVGTPRNRLVLVLLATGAWLADALCLQLALLGAGVHMDPDIVLLADLIGVLAASVPLLPGGLGIVEAAIPTVLHRYGAPLDAALGGVLVYRALTVVVPAAMGALVVLRLGAAGRGETTDSAGTSDDGARAR